MTYNEQTKKNQGDEIAYNVHDGDRHMIFEQPECPDRCPVHTFELYMSKLTESNDFFQTPNHQLGNPIYDKWYKKVASWCWYYWEFHGNYLRKMQTLVKDIPTIKLKVQQQLL